MSRYNIRLHYRYMHRGSGRLRFLHDSYDSLQRQELIARIRSGDYFDLLATRLDQVSQSIEKSNPSVSIDLQQLVEELLYVQRHYRLEKR